LKELAFDEEGECNRNLFRFCETSTLNEMIKLLPAGDKSHGEKIAAAEGKYSSARSLKPDMTEA